MNDIECPYCEEGNIVNHDDGQGYAEDVTHEMDCNTCGKTFVFHTSISYHYSPSKADCLNGAPHRYSEWRKLWINDEHIEIQTRRCKDCDHSEQRAISNSATSRPQEQ